MSKRLPQRYTCFDDFPNNIKNQIKTIKKDDFDGFVNGEIVAAQNRFLLDIISEANGEE